MSTLKKIADELHKANIKEILLLGGDPAEYRYLKELVSYLKELQFKIKIQSNSLIFNDITCDNIAKYFYSIETTIHSHSAASHDLFCGCEGAYDNAINKLILYQKSGVDIGIAINLLPSNCSHIYDIVINIIDNGLVPDYILIQRIVSVGKSAKNKFIPYKITVEMLREAALNVRKVHEILGVKVCYEDNFPYCISPDLFTGLLNKCKCGYNWMSVDYNGNVTRCPTDTKNILGNVLDQSLIHLWNNSQILIDYRNKMHLPQTCHNCNDLNICGGGCPMSYSDDQFCSIDYLFDQFRSDCHVE